MNEGGRRCWSCYCCCRPSARLLALARQRETETTRASETLPCPALDIEWALAVNPGQAIVHSNGLSCHCTLYCQDKPFLFTHTGKGRECSSCPNKPRHPMTINYSPCPCKVQSNFLKKAKIYSTIKFIIEYIFIGYSFYVIDIDARFDKVSHI